MDESIKKTNEEMQKVCGPYIESITRMLCDAYQKGVLRGMDVAKESLGLK